MKNFIKSIIEGTRLEPIIRKLIKKSKINFRKSSDYWEQRYLSDGNSGAGSYGRLAEFKAVEINKFVEENEIATVIEFGSGDGNQLTLAKYPQYLGLDVSATAIKLCKEKFKKDRTKSFSISADVKDAKAELSLSLDVIYHLVEDGIYSDYMTTLFNSSQRYVCIYASNYTSESAQVAEHVRHREFTSWIHQNASDFELISEIKNPYPYDANDPHNTSFSDLFFFKKRD